MDPTFREKIASALEAAYPDRAKSMIEEIERWFAQDSERSSLCSLCGQERFPQVLFYRGSTEFHGGGRVTPPRIHYQSDPEIDRRNREVREQQINARREERARERAERRERERAEAHARGEPILEEDDESVSDEFLPAPWLPPVPNARFCYPCSQSRPRDSSDAVRLVRDTERALRAADDSADWVLQALERRVFGTECPLCDAHVESLIRGRGVDLCEDCFQLGVRTFLATHGPM